MQRSLAALIALVALPAHAAEPGERLSTAVTAAASAPAGTAFLPRMFERFRLFPHLAPKERPPLELPSTDENKRMFHQTGDPDALFTFGKATPQGVLRLKAAFEVNEVFLKALTPDGRVDPNDTRPRAAGDFRALDSSGRPYQLRLGARLVW